eukprot:CAMPEP_0184199848 /NCGR_PEP_ID=MMETSP0976-20121227/7234_1 /TAXON_ID=483370 /ORGANISM="non described non described, Strain CCMP2097" /LENGTH=125 /DNA_ID=CAMNT_0026504351 /DNA_START=1 /DNA_END=376 /DNA_ORIENTATION=-
MYRGAPPECPVDSKASKIRRARVEFSALGCLRRRRGPQLLGEAQLTGGQKKLVEPANATSPRAAAAPPATTAGPRAGPRATAGKTAPAAARSAAAGVRGLGELRVPRELRRDVRGLLLFEDPKGP